MRSYMTCTEAPTDLTRSSTRCIAICNFEACALPISVGTNEQDNRCTKRPRTRTKPWRNRDPIAGPVLLELPLDLVVRALDDKVGATRRMERGRTVQGIPSAPNTASVQVYETQSLGPSTVAIRRTISRQRAATSARLAHPEAAWRDAGGVAVEVLLRLP